MPAPRSVRGLARRIRAGGTATESVWSLGLELTMLVSSVLSFTFLGRVLGPGGYGGYASLYAVIAPLVTLAASGVTLALLQHAIRDEEPLDETARSCVSLTLVIGAILVAVGGGIAAVVVQSLSTAAIVAILVTEFLAAPLVQVAAATVQAGSSFIGAAQIRLLLVAGRIAILVFLFVTDSLSVGSLGVSQLTMSAILAAISLGLVGRRFGFTFLPGPIRARHLKTNAIYSAAISAFALQNDGDKTIMAANRFVIDTGLYAAAYRIVLLGLVPVGSVVKVSHNRFLARGEGEAGRHLRLALRFGLLTSIYAVLFMVAVLIAAPALPVVLGDEFEGSVTMVRWIAPLVLLRTLAMFPLNGLMGLGKTTLRTVLIVVIAALSMVLYVTLIPTYGWEGAVAATMIGDGLLVVASWVLLVVHQRRADAALVSPPPTPVAAE